MSNKLTLYIVTLLASACSTDRGEAGGGAGSGPPDATGADAVASSPAPVVGSRYDATLDCVEAPVRIERLYQVGTQSPYNSPEDVCVISPEGDAYVVSTSISWKIEKDPSASAWKVPDLVLLDWLSHHDYSEFTADEQALCSAAIGAFQGVVRDGGVSGAQRSCPTG
jgi:hypothetical protein